MYLLFRNFADCLYDDRVGDRLQFIADAYHTIKTGWARLESADIDALIEPARRFSADREYDTETWGGAPE